MTGQLELPGLAGRTVVVTGAAGGQGLAECRLLAESGADVVGCDLAEAADPVGEFHRLDVSSADDWQRLADHLASTGRSVRGLVNNAGVTHRARLGQTELADWNRVLSVNLTGAMLGIQALLPLMAAGSSIVNVGSLAALNAHYTAAYTASKWGLRGLTHVAATEFGARGIRCNIVHPGFIETDMTASAPAAMVGAQLALTPLDRVGQADEVAAVVGFLLSDASGYVTGAEIPVDGGFSSSAGVKFMADRIAAAAAPTTSN